MRHQPNKAKSGFSKQAQASALSPNTTKYEKLPTHPIVISSKYVHVSIIDLMPVKACEILLLFPTYWTDNL